MPTKKEDQVSDVNPITVAQYESLIGLSIVTRIPLIVVGDSGCGKTSIPFAYAKSLGIDCVLLNYSDKSPAEVGGYGVPDRETRNMWFSVPPGLPTVERVGDQRVLCILDELWNYDPQVSAMLHSALYAPEGHPRYIGSHEIGPNVVFLATSNLRRHGARVVKATIPQVARVIYATLVPAPREWVAYMDKQYESTHVPAFVEYHATMGEGASILYSSAEEFDPHNPTPFSCHRAWESVCRIRDHFQSTTTVQPTERIAMQGCWGERTQLSFEGFLRICRELPSVKAAMQGRVNVSEDPAKQYAFMSVCLTHLTGISDDPAVDLENGGFDWFIDLVLQCHGEIARYGVEGGMRRNIPFDRDSRVQHFLFA